MAGVRSQSFPIDSSPYRGLAWIKSLEEWVASLGHFTRRQQLGPATSPPTTLMAGHVQLWS